TTWTSCRTRCADREVLALAAAFSSPLAGSPGLPVPGSHGGARPSGRRPGLLRGRWREQWRRRWGRRPDLPADPAADLADLPSSADRHSVDDRHRLRVHPVPEERADGENPELGLRAAGHGLAVTGGGPAGPGRPARAGPRVLGGPLRGLRLRALRP